ncbi:DUF4097 family beta strand repeat-containing protein [Acidobacteriota bacterium]
MKRKFEQICLYALVILIAGSFLYAQEGVDKATVPLSKPGKPAVVEASTQNGAITVTGYNGNEVIVEATIVSKEVKDEDEKANEKAQGLKRIQVNTTGLSIEENDNYVEISVQAWRQTVNLDIRVPFNSSLQLHSYKGGDITVANVKGELEIDNYSGSIKLTDISGAAVAHSYRGGVTATFKEINPDSHMSFTSMSGDIDVTFPSSTKANLKMKSDRGDVYSDFEFQIVKDPKDGFEFKEKEKPTRRGSGISTDVSVRLRDIERSVATSVRAGTGRAIVVGDNAKGVYQIAFGNFIYAKINGGGPVFQFKNYTGDIMIRKGK